jgi:outer membrane murein-binding lipoprotein Lpp
VEGKPAWSRLTLPLPQVVRVVSRALLTCLFCAAFTSIFPAQQDDPSEIFLKAYLSAQQAEKLEHENRFKNALAKFRFAGSLIEELRRVDSEWQPAIVEYRGRKIGEGILRIQERISRQNDLHATASPLPDIVPSLPEGEAWSEPGPEVVAPQVTGTISQRSSDATIEDATRNLRGKVDQLQKALEQSRSELETARKDKEAVNARLQETSFSLTDAQKEIDTRKKSERQVREQLVEISQGNGATEQLRAQIADLKKQVAVAQGASAAAEKQRDEANAKLADVNRQIAAVEQQRDAALVRLKIQGETQQQALVPIAENSDFTLIPAGTRNMRSADDDSTGPGELGGATQEVTQIQQQLAESQKQNQYLIARIGELWVQLDEPDAQLQRVKQTGKNSEELDQLIRENEVLRNIVVRERQEEVRRAEAKKRMLAELDGLKIKSDTLNREIELLAQPVPKLSSEEVSVLEKPVVSTSDENRGVVTAHFIFAKKSAEDSAEPEAPVNGSSRSKGEVREDLQSVAHAATGNLNSTSARQKATSETLDQGSE